MVHYFLTSVPMGGKHFQKLILETEFYSMDFR